jgi:hypothetical protein
LALPTIIRHITFLITQVYFNITQSFIKVEEAIQSRFAKYQQDKVFLTRRQKHADLRSKLDVLKKRIADWEKNAQQLQNQPTGEMEKQMLSEPSLSQNKETKGSSYFLDDMMVM